MTISVHGLAALRLLATAALCSLPMAAAVQVEPQPAQDRPSGIAPSNVPEAVQAVPGSSRQPAEPSTADLSRWRLAYPDIAETIGLDPATQQRLFELLSAQGQRATERSFERLQTTGTADPVHTFNEPLVETYNRERSELKQLLGEERFWRYLSYVDSISERRRVAQIDTLLPDNRLSSEQRERLVQLLVQLRQDDLEAQGRVILLSPGGGGQEQERTRQLLTLRTSEQSLQSVETLSKRALQGSASILNAAQQTVFTQLEEARIAVQRSDLRRLRAQAGQRPDTPFPSVSRAEMQMAKGPLRWSLELAVNRDDPQQLEFSGANGRPVTFAVGDDLVAEAVPMLYQGGWLQVKLALYERDRSGRHLLGDLVATGNLPAKAQNSDSPTFATVMAGSKGYAVAVSVAARR